MPDDFLSIFWHDYSGSRVAVSRSEIAKWFLPQEKTTRNTLSKDTLTLVPL